MDATTFWEGRDEITTGLLTNLKNIHGHVRGIERMVENGDYCTDIVNQILAVQRALQKVNGMVLGCHLHTCVTIALYGDDPDERERVIDAIMAVFEVVGKL